ncbi:MAG: hypothetical protein WD001_01870 [Woeseia sp.]
MSLIEQTVLKDRYLLTLTPATIVMASYSALVNMPRIEDAHITTVIRVSWRSCPVRRPIRTRRLSRTIPT